MRLPAFLRRFRRRDVLRDVVARARLSPVDRAYLHLGEVTTEAALDLETAGEDGWRKWIMKKNTALALAIQAVRGTHHKPPKGSPDDA